MGIRIRGGVCWLCQKNKVNQNRRVAEMFCDECITEAELGREGKIRQKVQDGLHKKHFPKTRCEAPKNKCGHGVPMDQYCKACENNLVSMLMGLRF